MFCTSCGLKLPDEARFCASCGTRVSSQSLSTATADHQAQPAVPPAQRSTEEPVSDNTAHVTPVINTDFRTRLLDLFLQWLSSQELSRWLQDLGQDAKGSAEEKTARIRAHTQFLSMPPAAFSDEVFTHLRALNSVDVFSDICREFGLQREGSKAALFRRIYREVGYREGWLTPIKDASAIDKRTVLRFVRWYPITKWSDYERDYYDDFADEMIELFGEDNVHEEIPVAHGSTLKIDFHIGHPQNGGVGVEFKLPANNNELQRALGQVDQYLGRYGSNLIVVLIPHLLKSTEAVLFRETLQRKGIETVMKTQGASSIPDQRAA